MRCEILRRIERRTAKFVLPVLLLLVFCVAAGFGNESLTVRVLTYNIHHGEGMDGRFDYERLAGIIQKLDPDLVALQEVDRGTSRSSGVDQAVLLGQLTGLESVYGRSLYYQGGEYGEAVLSRFPIVESKTYPLPFRPGREPRAALAVKVRPSEGLPGLVFVGTHLCHQEEAVRMDQVTYLDSLFAGLKEEAVILTGDFNARKGSAPMDFLLKGSWRDSSETNSRIDFILLRKADSWEVKDFQVLDENVASDHPPVFAELEWIQ